MRVTARIKRLIVNLVLLASVLAVGCSKELSEENGGTVPGGGTGGGTGTGSGGTAEGSLGNSGGTCGGFQVHGLYGELMALDTSNSVDVSLNITSPGTYMVTSDTVNGIYFAVSGSTTSTGSILMSMTGNGTPTKSGAYSFNVNWKGSTCSFQVIVYPVVAAGTGDYFPMTANSRWTYKSNDPTATNADTALQVSTGLQGSLPGGSIVYNLFTTDYGTGDLDSSFYHKSGNNYHELTDVDILGVSAEVLQEDFIFLKDDQNEGATWETSLMSGAPATGTGTVKTKRVFTLAAKNVKALVHDKIYTNVIKVNVDQVVENASGGFNKVISYESWFAKGIGLINFSFPAPYYGLGLIKHTVY